MLFIWAVQPSQQPLVMFLCSAIRHVGQRQFDAIVLLLSAVRAGGNLKTMTQESNLLVQLEITAVGHALGVGVCGGGESQFKLMLNKWVYIHMLLMKRFEI